MNRRLMTILLCAFFVAAGASYIVYRLVGKEVKSRRRTAKVVLAASNLQIGTLIKPTDLKMGEVVGEAPPGVVLKIETAVGRGVVSDLYAGEPVVEKRLAPAGSGGGLAATIPAGMRACAVKVNEVVGVAGFVLPGMRVDVIISGNNTPGQVGTEGMKVKTLLQNIEVLSAGTNFQKDNEGKPVQVPVVNLLVTPEQAELLSLASNETKIQLVLRNPLDREFTKTPGTEIAGLFGGRPAKRVIARPISTIVPKPVPPPPVIYTVQVINGGKSSVQTFSESGVRQ